MYTNTHSNISNTHTNISNPSSLTINPMTKETLTNNTRYNNTNATTNTNTNTNMNMNMNTIKSLSSGIRLDSDIYGRNISDLRYMYTHNDEVPLDIK